MLYEGLKWYVRSKSKGVGVKRVVQLSVCMSAELGYLYLKYNCYSGSVELTNKLVCRFPDDITMLDFIKEIEREEKERKNTYIIDKLTAGNGAYFPDTASVYCLYGADSIDECERGLGDFFKYFKMYIARKEQ